MSDLEFGVEYRPYMFGLGGYIQGQNEGVVNRLNQMLMSATEKFFSMLSIAFEKINDFRPIDRQTRDLITEFASTMPHMEFKNATAFILGCLASKNHKPKGPSLNKQELKKITSLLQYFKETDNISTTDIIRYARFAMLNNFKLDETTEEESSDEESV